MNLNVTQNPIGYFLYKGLRFLILMVILDLGIGFLLNQLYFAQESGKFARVTHSVMETDAEVLLVGTSHTVRHLVPQIFADSLGQTVYNIGARGQNLYYCAAVVDAVLDRYTPEKLVVNIDAEMFFAPDNYDKLSDLKPYFWKAKAVQPYLEKRSLWERSLLLSRLYTYNSTLIHLLKYKFFPQKDFDGYLPIYEVSQKKVSEAAQKLNSEDFEVTESQLSLLESMITKSQAKGTKVVFVISPILAGDRIHNSAIESLAARYDVPLWNYSLDKRFVLKNELFGDQSHLNHDGAVLLSTEIAHRIKSLNSEKLAEKY